MPSPIPLTRFLPRDYGPCSSPVLRHRLEVPPRDLPEPSSSSHVYWPQLGELEPIGAGGFGSVYRARYFGRMVAVKKVKKCAKNRLASRHSYWAELNAAHLQHGNVVSVLAASACGDGEDCVGTIIMEYVEGQSLQSLIYGANQEPLGPDRCVRYAVDVARGLRFLHGHRIVHLDLKPANVLVSEQDVCKIADFGCSQKLESQDESPSQATPHLGGTYTHRAPELLKGEQVTCKADLYSFGITFWQLLTREQPYPGERQAVLYAVVAFDLRPCVDTEWFSSTEQGQRCKDLLCRSWDAMPANRPDSKRLERELERLSL